MIINRIWSMPSSDTFTIKPIKELISKVFENKENYKAIDPFVRNSIFKNLCITNDLDEFIIADYHLDALDFLKMFKDNEIDIVLFDPPYSPRQISECYKKMNKVVNMETTQSSFWSKLKVEISKITKENAVVVSCGWNSGGIGKKYGFNIEEILMVPHGGNHNDTIVVVERKGEINGVE